MNSKLALITFMDGSGGSIDNTLPSGPNYPSAGPIPPGGALLPVYPFDPTLPNQGLPGSQPGIDNTLPGQPGYGTPQPIVPGKKFIVKYLACVGLIMVPDNTLPATPEPK